MKVTGSEWLLPGFMVTGGDSKNITGGSFIFIIAVFHLFCKTYAFLQKRDPGNWAADTMALTLLGSSHDMNKIF